MFVRVKSTPNSPRKTVQIVANKRVGNQVQQRIVRYVGVAMNDKELVLMKELAESIRASLEAEAVPQLFNPDDMAQMAIAARRKAHDDDEALRVDLKKLCEEQRVVVGVHEIYGKLFDELGLNSVVGAPSRRMQVAKIIKHLVMARIAHPSSKRQSVMELERDFGIKLDLNAVYRSLDALTDEALAVMQKRAWDAATSLFKESIDVVFYDCTTLFFESFDEDEFREKGFSKDQKINQTQVLLALMVTKEGLPLGYRLYSGSTAETSTLKDAVAHIEQQVNLQRIVFVADSGLLSKENLELLARDGKQYIVAARLRKLPEKVKQLVLDKERYQAQEHLLVNEVPLVDGSRLIVTFSQKRATKDAYDRKKMVDKLTKKLNASQKPQSFLSNAAYKKFLTLDSQEKVTLNTEKIEMDAQWDGLHGVITNIPDMEASAIVAQYKGLWQVEETFRLTKHDLRVRPIYHWTQRRIQAHLAICFMALTCIRHLTYRVKLQYRPLSAEAIRNELVHVQQSILVHTQTKKRYGIPSKPTPDAQKIYQVMSEKLSPTPFEIK